MTFLKSAALGAVLMCTTSAASAAVVVNTFEQGSDVLFDYSGTLDTTGLTLFNLFALGTYVLPSIDGFINVPTVPAFANSAFTSVTGSAGTKNVEGFATSSFGDVFAFSSIANGELFLPTTFTSGDMISGGGVFGSQSLASLGLLAGDIVYTLPSEDTITWKIRAAAAPVPLPAGLPLVLSGVAAFAWAARRKTRP